MDCALLLTYHPMIGVDFHDTYPVAGAPLVPRQPHGVGAYLRFGPWLLGTRSKEVDCRFGNPMMRGTDIKAGIPHIPWVPNFILYPLLYTAMSGSQSHFGVSTVQTEVGPVAVAVLKYVNFNLNCEGPLSCPPLPTGMVIAHNTVLAGMTMGDFIAGLVTMVAISLLQFAFDHILPFLTKLGGRLLKSLLKRVLGGVIRMLPLKKGFVTAIIVLTLRNQIRKASPAERAVLNELFGLFVDWSSGSPMGFSFEFAQPQDLDLVIGKAAHDYFAAPEVDSYPGAAPAAGAR
jgi:hypothetical protein